MAIFIMGVGMLAELSLFPLGAVSMAQQVREDRAAKNAATIASALHAYFDRYRRFPGSLDEILSAAGYPQTGVKDAYKVALVQLEPASVVLANEPGLPGVHGWRTVMMSVSRPNGQPSTQIGFVAAPGAAQGQQQFNDTLLAGMADAVANITRLLSAAENAALAEQLAVYLRQTPPAVAVQPLTGPDGTVSLPAIKSWLLSYPDPLRMPLNDLWRRTANALAVPEFGTSWWMPPDKMGPGLFTFASLARLTAISVPDPVLCQQLLGLVQQAETAASSGLHAEKQAALKAYVAIVDRYAGTAISTARASTMRLIASTLSF